MPELAQYTMSYGEAVVLKGPVIIEHHFGLLCRCLTIAVTHTV